MKLGRNVGLITFGMLLGYAGGLATLHALSQQKMPIEPKGHGVTLDLGFSDNRFTPSPDNQWYQKDQEHSSRYKAAGGTVGLSFDLNPAWTVGIHYVSLGRPHVDALAVAFPADDRAKMVAGVNTTRPACGAQYTEACLYQWHTAAYVRGLNFSTSFRLFEVEGVRFDAKLGAYVNQMSQAAIVEPLGCRDNCPWRIQVDQSVNRVSPMWGAVVRWKWLFVSWEAYEGIGGRPSIPADRDQQITANVKGRVEVKTIGVRIPL